MKKKIFLVAISIFLGATLAAADSNLHTLVGTLESCGCDLYPVYTASFVQNDWICRANFSIAAPSEHFSEGSPAFVAAEIVGQALGQCSELEPLLPRRVQMLFWLEAAGLDYVHGGIVRSPIRGYFLVDLGP